MKRSNILAACTWPGDLWALAKLQAPSPAVAALLAGFYAVALDVDALALWRELTGQTGFWRRLTGTVDTLATPGKFLIVCVGRRGLKSSGIIAWTCVYEALCGGHEAHAVKGGRIYFAIIAPGLRQAAEAVRAVRVALDQLAPIGVEYTVREAQDRVEITLVRPACGVERVISVMTASDVSVRGFAIASVFLDEAGFLRSEQQHISTDKEILQALLPGTAQFPNAKIVLASTPGPTGTLFHGFVEKPPKGAVVVRAPTWVMNPRISEAQCRALSIDDRHFDQEYRVARFGALGEAFLDEDALLQCVDDETCSRRPQGDRAIGGDLGLVHDATAIVRVRVSYIMPHPGAIPIVHVIVEHVEQHRGERTRPLQLPAILDRFASIAKDRTCSGTTAPVMVDQHLGPEVIRGLAERGVKATQCPMNPMAQEKRWRLLADLIRSRRLHIPNNPELISQLSKLKVTQLASGAHKVEGRRDDLADALALVVEYAVEFLSPCGDSSIDWELDQKNDFDGRLSGFTKRWFQRFANGNRLPIAAPRGTDEYEEERAQRQCEGISVPSDYSGPDDPAWPFNVPIKK